MTNVRLFSEKDIKNRISKQPKVCLTTEEQKRIDLDCLPVLAGMKEVKSEEAIDSAFSFIFLHNAKSAVSKTIFPALRIAAGNANQILYKLLMKHILKSNPATLLSTYQIDGEGTYQPLDCALRRFFHFKFPQDLEIVNDILKSLSDSHFSFSAIHLWDGINKHGLSDSVKKEIIIILLNFAARSILESNPTETEATLSEFAAQLLKDYNYTGDNLWDWVNKKDLTDKNQKKIMAVLKCAPVESKKGEDSGVMPMDLSSDEIPESKSSSPKSKSSKKKVLPLPIKQFENKIYWGTFNVSSSNRLVFDLIEGNDSYLAALARTPADNPGDIRSIIATFWTKMVGDFERGALGAHSLEEADQLYVGKMKGFVELLLAANTNEELKDNYQLNVFQQAAKQRNSFLTIILDKLNELPYARTYITELLANILEGKIAQGKFKDKTLYDLATEMNQFLIQRYQKILENRRKELASSEHKLLTPPASNKRKELSSPEEDEQGAVKKPKLATPAKPNIPKELPLPVSSPKAATPRIPKKSTLPVSSPKAEMPAPKFESSHSSISQVLDLKVIPPKVSSLEKALSPEKTAAVVRAESKSSEEKRSSDSTQTFMQAEQELKEAREAHRQAVMRLEAAGRQLEAAEAALSVLPKLKISVVNRDGDDKHKIPIAIIRRVSN